MAASDATGRMLGGRYAVGATLGAGAMGAVYRARHVGLDRDVALKVLQGDGVHEPRARRRLHREARAVARIRNPHVVQVFDYGQADDGQPFLVMELIDGRTAASYFRQPRPLADVLAAVDGVLAGLAAAHARGVLHRDLKPANMILRDGDPGQLVLLDFGIAAVLGGAALDEGVSARATSTRLTMEGSVVGTPLYMSPEQAMGLDLGPASDLYAAGIVLWEWLCGQPPFKGDVMTVMRAHIQDPLPPFRPRAGLDVPPRVAAALQRALDKEPDARFPSAAAMRDALLHERPESDLAVTVTQPMSLPVSALAPLTEDVALRLHADLPLTGRESIRNTLRAAAATALSGAGGIVLIEGEEGLGKSRLANDLFDGLQESGEARVGRAAMGPRDRGDRHVIAAALDDLLGSASLDAATLREVALRNLPLAGHEIDALVEFLRPAVAPDEPSWDALAAVERALRALSAARPVALLWDGIDGAGKTFGSLLEHIAVTSAITPCRVLIVLTRRPREQNDPLRGLWRFGNDVLLRVALPALPGDEVERLVQRAAPLSRGLARTIAARAGGSPLIAGLLLRHLSDRGALRRTAAGLDAEESSLREAHELPETLAALLGGRLDSATDVAPDPALARALLEAASLLSPEPSVGDVLALLDAGSATVDRHAADDALDVLIAGSVLTEVRGSEDRIGWATPLLRDAQRARLVGTRRGRRLAQAAASLRASEAPRPARARDLIDVLDLAGQPDAALPFVVDAAEASLAAGDLAESARLFARALPTATGPLRSRCLQGAGETDHLLGRATAAEAAFRTLLTEATSDLDRARAAFRLGRALLLAGRPAEARGPLRDAVGTLSAVSGAEAALELSRAFRALLAAEPDGASIPPLDAERLLGEARGPADRCVHGTTLGYAALRSGDPAAAADRFRAALREADGAGYAPAVVAVLHDLGLALRLARKHDQAIRHLQDAIDLAERARQHPSAARAHNELGELHRERGDLGAAATHYERAASIWDELSSPQAPLARMNLAIVAADRGHLDHAERQLTKALSSLSKDLRGPAAVTRAYVAALSGRAEDATSAIREAASLLGGPSPEASNLLSRAAFALADRGEEAASAAARALAERLLAPASRT